MVPSGTLLPQLLSRRLRMHEIERFTGKIRQGLRPRYGRITDRQLPRRRRLQATTLLQGKWEWMM
jgi:predicted DNA-binding transcriptional regulator AlpA